MTVTTETKTVDDLGTHLADLNALVNHFTSVVEEQIEKAGRDGIRDSLELHQRVLVMLKNHSAAIKQQTELHSGNLEIGAKEMLTSFLGTAAGLYNKFRDYPETRALRDNYCALSLLAASLTSLKTYGLMCGNETVSKMAYDMLAEVCPLIVEISHSMVAVVARETAQRESLPYDPAVVERVTNAVKRCWSV